MLPPYSNWTRKCLYLQYMGNGEKSKCTKITKECLFSIKNYTMIGEYTSQTDTIVFVGTDPFRIRQGKRFLST